MSVLIRAATPGDEGEILRMIKALAAFEREPDAVVATEGMLAESLFGAGSHVHAHIATRDGCAIGMALWFLNF